MTLLLSITRVMVCEGGDGGGPRGDIGADGCFDISVSPDILAISALVIDIF